MGAAASCMSSSPTSPAAGDMTPLLMEEEIKKNAAKIKQLEDELRSTKKRLKSSEGTSINRMF